MTGKLLTDKPSCDPIEYTNFDSWFANRTEEGASIEERMQVFEDASITDKMFTLNTVLRGWENTLECNIVDIAGFSTSNQMMLACGLDLVIDRAVLYVLTAGYDVYRGDTCIMIYKPEQLAGVTPYSDPLYELMFDMTMDYAAWVSDYRSHADEHPNEAIPDDIIVYVEGSRGLFEHIHKHAVTFQCMWDALPEESLRRGDYYVEVMNSVDALVAQLTLEASQRK